MNAKTVFLVATLGLLAATQSNAQHLFEPEIGFKVFDGKTNDDIAPGFSYGGEYGRVVSASTAVTLHLDVGLHSARRRGDYGGNPGGGSFDVAIGTMFSPDLREHRRSLAPYVGAAAGHALAGVAGGEASWTLGVEGGARFGATGARNTSVGVRIVRHFWLGTDSMPSSNEFVIAGRWLFRIPV